MQAYVSRSLEGLDFHKRYGLTPYTDRAAPLIMFGMYRDEDFDILRRHDSFVTLVWQGMDARVINEKWLPFLRLTHIRHIAISHWIQNSLSGYGIPNELIPVSATSINMYPVKRGNSVFLYYSDNSDSSRLYYGATLIPEIESRTGMRVQTAILGEYGKDALRRLYADCFINLRLTVYDGCPNTNLEMGLMGRRSIFNGHIPHSIPWQNIDDICASIITEFERRHEPNEHISNDIANFLNITFP
jgi:hypothetical protein